MNIIDITKDLFNINIDSYPFAFSERILIVEMSFSVRKTDIPKYVDLLEYISIFSNRDSVILKIIDYNDNIISINKDTNQDAYNSFLLDLQDQDELDIKIEINKSIIDNKLSVYNYDSFSKDILGNNISKIFEIFNNLLENQNKLLFCVYDKEIFWCTKTIVFTHHPNTLLFREINRNDLIDTIKGTTYNYSYNYSNLIPDDFLIVNDYSGNNFTSIFGTLLTILSLASISSIVSNSNESIRIQINGQRSISFEYEYSKIKTNDQLYKIYNWIYNDGNPTDKSIIAHNVISLHCKYSSILDIDERTFLSISSNYQLYLKENANQYLELKNKVSEFIFDINIKIGNEVSELSSNLRNNLIGILGFMLSVVLVNLVSENPLDDILTKEIVGILYLILAASFFYLIVCRRMINSRFEREIIAYDELKNNYNDVFSKEEIDNIFDNDNIINKAKNEHKNGVKFISRIWCCLIIVAFFIIDIFCKNPLIVDKILNIMNFVFKLIKK